MGFFERLGRTAEAVKQQVDSARAAEATHRCAGCGELLYADRETCPECGSDAVEGIDGDAAGEAAGPADSGDDGGTDGEAAGGATEAAEDGEPTADADETAER